MENVNEPIRLEHLNHTANKSWRQEKHSNGFLITCLKFTCFYKSEVIQRYISDHKKVLLLKYLVCCKKDEWKPLGLDLFEN